MQWIIGIIASLFAVMVGLLGIERRKTRKEKEAKQEAQAEVSRLKVSGDIQQKAYVIKDDLTEKKQDVETEKTEVEKEVEAIQGEANELSEDVKKLAAKQSRRSRARADRRVSDD
jgi:membrane protein implicated in regulation of membrane protease activity